MFKGVTDFFVVLGQLLPPWAVATLGVLVFLAVLPGWLHSLRVKQINGTVRRMVRADGRERKRLEAHTFDLAGERIGRLEAVAHAGNKFGQQAVRDRALARLDALGRKDLADKIRNKDRKPPERVIGHPLEATVPIRRMLEQGMFETASVRLDEALGRFPGDPDLIALQAQLERLQEEEQAGS